MESILLALATVLPHAEEAAEDPWKAALDAIHAQADEEWFQSHTVREVRPEQAPRHAALLKSFTDCRLFSLDLVYVPGHPEAKGAISSGASYLIRKGDPRPYRRGKSEDLVAFARAQGLAFPDRASLRAYLDFHHFFFAGGDVVEQEDGSWRVTSPASGVPRIAVWRLRLDEKRRLESLEFVASEPMFPEDEDEGDGG